MFRTERLHALHAVDRHGSLAAAAEALHLTPSAVSQQLSKLERDAGAPLLVPHGRSVKLTPAGRLLADAADTVLGELALARTRLDALSGDITGPMRVGSIPTGVYTFVTRALTSLAGRHPGIEPAVVEAEPERSLPMLVNGQLDVAVVESWDNLPLTRPPHTHWRALRDDTARVMLPADDPRADRPTISAADLDRDRWVSWTAGSRANAWLCHTLRERGIEPDIRHYVTGYATVFSLVEGLGALALLPSLALVVASGHDVRAVELDAPAPRRTLYAVTAEQHPRPALEACLDALADAAHLGDA
ncbi:LysR family transcriptional regulator [Prauserella rugosa]|uniref:DNA-binding transcriptional LysR family regulator n=1 Tax=Prauserella rugosa TaxID=43354 RepID=A0A660C8P9_9PSEU|nr:LysR family transcriptional regulator [Prauserella rugosa]KMS85398.1 LysR family transcriptional regulator [Streptomyces regensis]TWH18193.1 DNA-binding transcriptional LysR family regulator [Prauserella rugosa]TWH23011.1 DNA-binding transcriptional LysR family regulator [Prauserella rugosa]